MSRQPERLAPDEPGTAKPLIFVVGNSRSGTTMMGRILGGHPSIFTFGELHFFEQLWSPADGARHLSRTEAERLAARLLCIQREGYLNNQGAPERFYEEAAELVASIKPETMTPAKVFEAFLFYETARTGKMIPCDQTPRNVFYIGEVLRLYPEARVISMVRDPRDVLLSQKKKWKRRFLGARGIPLRESFRSWANYHPVTISKLWSSSVRAADGFSDDDRVYSLRFEDLLADPKGEVGRLCEFADISFDKSMLDVPQVGSSSGLDRPERRGINQDRASSWQKGGLSPTEIFLCQRITGALMKRHGYVPVEITPNLLRLLWSIGTLPAKLVLALLLNLRRMRNIKDTIRRRLS